MMKDPIMMNELTFIFKADDMKKLLANDPQYVVVKSSLEAGVLKDGTKVGYVKVWADGVTKGYSDPNLRIEGCPEPPCETGNDRR